jgi:hypothetical protein
VTEPNRWAGAPYVAMGSSFAAGPFIPHRVPGSPRAAGRSTGNYAHLVARRLGLNLVGVTFSGATTHEFVTRSKRPAQIAAVTESTRLVTLTGGGNDVGFAPRILLSSLPGPLRALPSVHRQLESSGPWTRRFQFGRGGGPLPPQRNRHGRRRRPHYRRPAGSPTRGLSKAQPDQSRTRAPRRTTTPRTSRVMAARRECST